MEKNAIINFLLICLCCVSLYSQGLKKEQVDSIYYDIINEIVLKDTIINKIKERYFEEELKLAILPQKQRDSIYDIRLKRFAEEKAKDSVQYNLVAKYYEKESKKLPKTIKEVLKERDRYESQKCFLFLQQSNKKLKNIFYKEIAKKGELLTYFGKAKIEGVLNAFPIESKLNESRVDPFIKTIERTNSFGHQFSSPVIIDGKIVVFHLRKHTEDILSSRILVYSLNGNIVERVEILEEVNTIITSRYTFDKNN